MIIPLGVNDTELPSEDISRIRLRNMYLMDNPLSPDKLCRVSRPTLTTAFEVGSGPINGIWQQEGSIGDRWLILSGEILYAYDGTSLKELGTLPGTDNACFAGNILKALIVRDGLVYSTDGTNLLHVAMPDNVAVASVACIDSVFLLSVKDDQVFYWMTPEQTVPDPLSFASAERTPDPIRAIAVASDEIWFLGGSSVEVWSETGNQDAPYQRIAGRVYAEGCAETHTVCVSSHQGFPCIMWVTDKRTVVLAQGQPNKVSNSTIEEALRNAGPMKAWMFRSNKDTFYVLSCSSWTYAYDLNTGSWAKWDSFGKAYWRAQNGLQVIDHVYAGDTESGKIFSLDDDISDDGDPIVREVSGFVPIQGKYVSCDSINVRVNSGYSKSYVENPVLEVRFSDDYGVTWSDYFQIPLGYKGQYLTDVTLRSLGTMYRPGRDFEFRFSEKDRFRIDYATINEV